VKCLLCEDTGWVCEDHQDRPAWAARVARPAHHAPAVTRRRSTSPRASRKVSSQMATKGGWSREFEDPIPLPRSRQLVTLEDAATYIMKLPKAERELPEWQLVGRY
jgi:hypothetical protein